MKTQIKATAVARTAVLIDGIWHEISAFKLGKGFGAKWHCGICGQKGAMRKANDSVLAAFNSAKARIYKHYERMHQGREERDVRPNQSKKLG